MKKFLLTVGFLAVSSAYGMEEGALVPAKEKSLDEQPLDKEFEFIESNYSSYKVGLTADVFLFGYACTPLHCAVSKATERTLKLLEKGENVNACGSEGMSPLQVAVWFGKSETVITLNLEDRHDIWKTLHFKVYDNQGMIKELLTVARVNIKTMQDVQDSTSKVKTLLLCLSMKGLPLDILKEVLLNFPEDIISEKMLEDLLPIADKTSMQKFVKYCPLTWVVTSLADKKNEVKRDEIIEDVIHWARTHATSYWVAADGFNMDFKCLDDRCTSFIHEAIKKEFLQESVEDSMSSSSSSSGKQEEH